MKENNWFEIYPQLEGFGFILMKADEEDTHPSAAKLVLKDKNKDAFVLWLYDNQTHCGITVRDESINGKTYSTFILDMEEIQWVIEKSSDCTWKEIGAAIQEEYEE
jgi:hypothetical protein